MAELRDMRQSDLSRVSAIYAAHAGQPPPDRWQARVGDLLLRLDGVALVAEVGGLVVGYLTGDVRVWEFGSESAGWIFGLGVAPEHQGAGLARAMLARGVARMRELGVTTVRTMVRGDDVAVLRLFRSGGFAAGPYTELEVTLGPSEEPA